MDLEEGEVDPDVPEDDVKLTTAGSLNHKSFKIVTENSFVFKFSYISNKKNKWNS